MTDLPFSVSPNDPLGCLNDLSDALEQPALAEFERAGERSIDAKRAAYRLTTALGMCRLFGVQVDADTDGDLPIEVATDASALLRENLQAWEDDARLLGERWDAAEDAEGESLCADLLEGRTEAWAAFVALDDAYQSAQARSDAHVPEFGSALREVIDNLRAFDQALYEQRDLLSIVTQMELLDNWRSFLDPEYREMLPWWLDGTLEACAEQLRKEMLASLPGPEAWKRLREQSLAEGPVIMPLRRHSMDVVPVETTPAHLAAAGTRDAAPTRVVGWRSPDGRYRARLHLPTEVTRGSDEELWLDFSTVDFDPAYELESQRVVLSDFELVIGSEARVVFRLAALQDARRRGVAELVLRVGPDGIEWSADRDERDSG